MKPNIKKLLILNAPYLLFVYLFDKVGQAVRLSPGADLSGKLLSIGSGFSAAFSNALPSFAPMDLLIGIVGAVVIRLAVYVKGKNAKKYRKGMEYGSARWGNAEDIKPYIDPMFENNVLLTQTERLMMSSRPKHPKYARNKNVLVIGGSGSGKTRFFVKPNLMQMHSSYVVTDPKGTVLIECGKLLQRGGYKIKVLNTINFKKSMRYNPFAYLRSEKDILKLVNTIIANTKGDGEKSGEDFWVKSERLFYCALIGYIWYEAPENEKNFTTLLEMINASEAREDDPEFQSPVDLMFERLEEKDPEHFAVRQYKKFLLSAGKTRSSMENEAIRSGFDNLKDGREYDALYHSALCRAKADWLIGINATRLFSCLYGKTLNVGRVQTPTLKMLVDRDAAIMNFKKEKYYHVCLMLSGAEAASAKIRAADEASELKAACEASAAVCTSLTREKKTVAPPKLFDLTSLQREANRIYGYTAKQTLDLAQTLYEKKLLTYPRTDSNYLTDDMGDTAKSMVTLLCGKLPFMAGVSFTPELAKVLNSKKVSDHHAIIPTIELAKADLSALPESERNILTLTGARLLMATAAPHVYEAVTSVFSCADHDFTARGKMVIAAGWKDIDRRFRATIKKKPDSDDEENELALDVPDYTEGQTFENPAAAVTEHDTTPPKPHNEASLLSAMERAGNEDTDPDAERRGLGTPATRAAVIEKLVKGGFIERKGKQLFPTKDGTNLVCVLPDSLTSPQLTAAWENNLTQIAKGNADPTAFMQGIEAMARELVKTYASVLGEKQALFKTEKTELGKCPRCKSPVYEGKKNYYCSNKECSFAMWKNDRFFEERKTAFTPKIAAALLKSGKAKIKKLYSPKTGKTYDGTVLLADTGGKYVNYKVTISKDKQLE